MRSHAGAWERSSRVVQRQAADNFRHPLPGNVSRYGLNLGEKRGKTACFLPGTINAYTLLTGLPLYLIERSFK